MKDSFVFFRSFFEAIECLEDDREKAAAYKAVVSYALDGTEDWQKGAVQAIMMMAKPTLDYSRRQYENGLKGGRPKKTQTKPTQNPTETQPKPNHNPYQNQNQDSNQNQTVSVSKEGGTGETPAGGHTPTAAQVTEYAKSIGYQLDGQTFVDKYEATGWTLGGSPIRDWKAMVRRWKAQDEKRAPEKNTKIHNFDERGDDLDDETARKWREKIAARRAERERTSLV